MTTQTPRFARLLLTGAAGTLGRQLAPDLAPLADELVMSDLPGLGNAAAASPGLAGRSRWQACDLTDRAAVRALLQGVDAVVHLGGVSVEKPFDVVLPANITGLFNLYEAARLAGTKRIVFASSNHVTGCYGVAELINETDPPRPDGYYGLSKFFGEGLASLYRDRWGIETVCLRIGTALPEPIDFRSLSSWISPRDLAQLVRCALTAPGVGFLVAFGMSGNTRAWWDAESGWARLGYVPQDDAEAFAAKVAHIAFPPGSPMARRRGRTAAQATGCAPEYACAGATPTSGTSRPASSTAWTAVGHLPLPPRQRVTALVYAVRESWRERR